MISMLASVVEKIDSVVEDVAREAHRDQLLTSLFNRAFAGDQLAWSELLCQLESLTRAWVGQQAYVDPVDVLQEAWLAFARYAPQQFCVVDEARLGCVLAYLRRCVKTALLELLRKERRQNQDTEALLSDDCPLTTVEVDAEEVALRFELAARIACLVKTPEEQYVWERYFVDGWAPRMIVAHGDVPFASIKMVNQIIQRLMRRFRNDGVLQELYEPAGPDSLVQACPVQACPW